MKEEALDEDDEDEEEPKIGPNGQPIQKSSMENYMIQNEKNIKEKEMVYAKSIDAVSNNIA
jgi:hypothetical protein